MAWTGNVYVRNNGVFTGPLVWTDDRDAGTKITAAHHDTHDQDIADGITACLNKNGANSPTANINWGSFRITSLGAGVADTDAAALGQTVSGVSLDVPTNVLSLTRVTGGDMTVDLSSLVFGGSTAPFARLASDQVFTGVNQFTQQLEIGSRLTLDSTTTSQSWRVDTPTDGLLTIAPNVGGAVTFTFVRDTGYGVAGGGLNIGGYRVWDRSQLTDAQVSAFLNASTSATITAAWTITGAWNFTNSGLRLPGFLWKSGAAASYWTCGPTDAAQLSFTDPLGSTSLNFVVDAAPISGAYLQIGTGRAWDQGSLRVIASGAPTGGEDNNLALVLTGGSQGLWCKVSGSWTKIITGP